MMKPVHSATWLTQYHICNKSVTCKTLFMVMMMVLSMNITLKHQADNSLSLENELSVYNLPTNENHKKKKNHLHYEV